MKFCTAALAGSLVGIAYERVVRDHSALASDHFLPRSNQPNNNNNLINNNNNKPTVHSDKRHLVETDPAIAGQNFKHLASLGFPSTDNIRLFDDFIVSYDRRLRTAAWTYEHLTPDKIDNNNHTDRSHAEFCEDKTLHEYFRSHPADYRGSGYDRGHLAAAGNHKLRQQDVEQTFVLSNISPQEPTFNREGWNKLEKYVRYRTKQSKNLFVVTGPLFLAKQDAQNGRYYVHYEVIGANQVSVPTHFFKVFAYETKEGAMRMEAFLMPNDKSINNKIRLEDYRVPLNKLDIIERSAGVIFFDRLPRNSIENVAVPQTFV